VGGGIQLSVDECLLRKTPTDPGEGRWQSEEVSSKSGTVSVGKGRG